MLVDEKPWRNSGGTPVGFGENERMPAPKAGGLYKTNCHHHTAVLLVSAARNGNHCNAKHDWQHPSENQGRGVAQDDTCGLFRRMGVAYSLSRVLP
jgi:hypothetical protein